MVGAAQPRSQAPAQYVLIKNLNKFFPYVAIENVVKAYLLRAWDRIVNYRKVSYSQLLVNPTYNISSS